MRAYRCRTHATKASDALKTYVIIEMSGGVMTPNSLVMVSFDEICG